MSADDFRLVESESMLRDAFDEIATLRRERDEARAFGEDLERWAREVTCVWCGHQFESTLGEQAEHLHEHARTCDKHPIRKAELALAERDAEVARLREAVRELRAMLQQLHVYTGRLPSVVHDELIAVLASTVTEE